MKGTYNKAKEYHDIREILQDSVFSRKISR